MKLYISQSDIDAGLPCIASRCAIAVAFTRATGLECRAGHDGVWVPGLEEMGEMSDAGSRFISLFDCDWGFCVPTVVEIFFSDSAPGILREDYVPATDLMEVIDRKEIKVGASPRMEYAC